METRVQVRVLPDHVKQILKKNISDLDRRIQKAKKNNRTGTPSPLEQYMDAQRHRYRQMLKGYVPR